MYVVIISDAGGTAQRNKKRFTAHDQAGDLGSFNQRASLAVPCASLERV